ncbi:MAG: nuclear transport factor 2 family protein [Elusimicrobiota bacterium]
MRKTIETRRIVESYFAAWTSNRVDDAYALLADNLEFSGPSANYKSAEEFRPGLTAFAKMTKGARILDFLVEDDRAAMLYDCDLPAPVGTLKIASFFRVENGKIRTYATLFDAAEFRKLLAR